MRYIEITATVPVQHVESAADIMRIATGRGVAIESAFVQRDLESDAEPSYEHPSRLRAYVSAQHSSGIAPRVEQELKAAGVDASVCERVVDEEDWAESWKEHFHVERFGRVVVVPSWREYQAQPDDVVLTLDPGMAFGTGQHETTRMCLEALAGRVRPGMRVLDVGCGSGILAIAAAKLGASQVHALDIDADCVRITEDNARRNGVDAITSAALAQSGPDWSPGDHVFDIIVANIVAAPLIELAPFIVRALAEPGVAILSGIIAAREQQVRDAYTAAGVRVASSRAMGEWRCIEIERE